MNGNPNKPRIARGYYQWLAPDMKKSGVKPFINDEFNAILPTKFYEWYEPYRNKYNTQNFKELEAALYAKAQMELDRNPEPKPISKKFVLQMKVLVMNQIMVRMMARHNHSGKLNIKDVYFYVDENYNIIVKKHKR